MCVICGAKTKLETHHITYRINGVSILGNELEFLEWIVTLCEKDHQKTHNSIKHPFNPSNKFKKSTLNYDFNTNQRNRT